MASSNIERIRQKRMAVRFAVMAFVGLGLVIFLSSRGDETKDSSVLSGLEDGVTPILAYLTMPIRGVETLMAEFEARGEVLEENKRLKDELVRLNDAEMRANALALKISKFEDLLQVDVGSGIASERIAARAVSERDGPFVRSALLNAGRNSGVEKGNAVMTADGLYGHIVRVGNRSSRALKLTDLNSRVAVMSLRSQGRAILTGNNTEFPLLSYVTNAEDWKVGDRVITSGDDGVLPRGLPVGKIREDKSGVMKVELNVDGARVDWVLVVPFIGIEALTDKDSDLESDDSLDVDVSEEGTPVSPEAGEGSTSVETPATTQISVTPEAPEVGVEPVVAVPVPAVPTDTTAVLSGDGAQ